MSSVDVIVAPYDSGQRGLRMGAGPLRLLQLGLVAELAASVGRVRTFELDIDDRYPAELERGFELQRRIADAAAASRADGALPIVLSGNCNAGVIGCLAAAGRAQRSRLGLIWFDAHGDFQTPETDPDGFLDSMGLAMATGRCWDAMLSRLDGFAPVPGSQVVMLATRQFDPGERELMDEVGIAVIPGAAAADQAQVAPALDALAGRTDEVHLHLDADAHDAAFGAANEWPEPDGLDGDAYLRAVGWVLERCRVGSVSVASYDPACDASGRIGRSCVALLVACAGAAGDGAGAF
jgi:arginase